MVGKVHAVDADAGYSVWLCNELSQATNSLWKIGLYNGVISTTSNLDEQESSSSQNLIVLVKDHGQPVLYAKATFSVSLTVNLLAVPMDTHQLGFKMNSRPLADHSNIYLTIAICLVPSLFLLVTIPYMAL